jgi:hypothetical protein
LGWGPGRKKIPYEEYLARRAAEFSNGCGNLAPYMGNQVGFLGGVLRLTNVPGVLAWDCLATDWFHEPAWPTTLVYNPYENARAVELLLPRCDRFFDAATGLLVTVERSAAGRVRLTLGAGDARVLVAVPETAQVVRHADGRVTAGGRTLAFAP